MAFSNKLKKKLNKFNVFNKTTEILIEKGVIVEVKIKKERKNGKSR